MHLQQHPYPGTWGGRREEGGRESTFYRAVGHLALARMARLEYKCNFIPHLESWSQESSFKRHHSKWLSCVLFIYSCVYSQRCKWWMHREYILLTYFGHSTEKQKAYLNLAITLTVQTSNCGICLGLCFDTEANLMAGHRSTGGSWNNIFYQKKLWPLIFRATAMDLPLKQDFRWKCL